MTQEEIHQRNKQIALMLGWYQEAYIWKVLKPFKDGFISETKDVELQFHSDWNRLMMAIQFLQDHFDNNGMIWRNFPYEWFRGIEKVFTVVSDFAKLYNEGKLLLLHEETK